MTAPSSDVMMTSRRTIMSGEVVTFSTAFDERDSAFGKAYDATGFFEVSASRDAVIVHKADCQNAEQVATLLRAIEGAEHVRRTLEPHWRGGHPSMFPGHPTIWVKP